MKISFSTLGCPTWDFSDIIAMAKDLGYDGIEIRGVSNEMYAPNSGPFLPVNLQNTKALLENKGLEISCLTTGAFLFDKENNERYMKEAVDYISLAARLGVPYIRVLGDAHPFAGENIDLEFVATNLRELDLFAEGKNVKVLIETNGVFADSKLLSEFIVKLNASNIGVLWDLHHPFRYIHESIADTYNRLKSFIKHVHIKDSVIQNEKVFYKMTGKGDIPIEEAIGLLNRDNYDGYISLEWTKRWNPEIEEAAIAFPPFIHYINEIKNK